MDPTLILRAVEILLGRIDRLLEELERKRRRAALDEETWRIAMGLLDLLVDTWIDLKAKKAVEGGYAKEVDQIDSLIDELRVSIKELHRTIRANELDDATKRAEVCRRIAAKIQASLRDLIHKQKEAAIRRLDEKQRRIEELEKKIRRLQTEQ